MKNTKTTMICNSKGGIGKTATTLAFAYGLANRGYKVLTIDFDAGSHLTSSFGQDGKIESDIYDWLIKNKDVRITITGNIDLIPATDKGVDGIVSKCRENLVSPSGYLSDGLSVYDEYDFILIDTPSTGMGYQITNSIVASDYIVIPTTPEYLSTKAMEEMASTIKKFLDYKPSLNLTGVFVNNVETSTALHKEGMTEIEEWAYESNIPFYSNFVRHTTRVGQRQKDHKDFYSCPSKNPAAQDFSKVVDEFLKKIGE